MRIGLLAVMSLSLLVACDLNAKHCPTVPPETSESFDIPFDTRYLIEEAIKEKVDDPSS